MDPWYKDGWPVLHLVSHCAERTFETHRRPATDTWNQWGYHGWQLWFCFEMSPCSCPGAALQNPALASAELLNKLILSDWGTQGRISGIAVDGVVLGPLELSLLPSSCLIMFNQNCLKPSSQVQVAAPGPALIEAAFEHYSSCFWNPQACWSRSLSWYKDGTSLGCLANSKKKFKQFSESGTYIQTHLLVESSILPLWHCYLSCSRIQPRWNVQLHLSKYGSPRTAWSWDPKPTC